ncbi:hypothetical protein [Pseudooceanicola nitratireducens]|uniref:hypothetical protein n=1 Tax=Pseudooceanicola nitratireducens TaxID=517719 RepID=UPI0023F41272|nr:hypothetical protein [Pseudooceanicola nitratireducens]
MNKPAVQNIIDTIGQEAICVRLGISDHAVRHAKTTGSFAALWYDAIDQMCIEAGIPCPRSAFNFKSPAVGAAARKGEAA